MDERTNEQAQFLADTIEYIRSKILARFCRAVRAELEPDMPELTLAQMHTLKEVHMHGPLTMKELANVLEVSAPSASAMVERLVEMEMLSREQNREDRREVMVQVTKRGLRFFERIHAVFMEALCDLLERVGPDCAEDWCRVYQRLRDVLAAESSSANEVIE